MCEREGERARLVPCFYVFRSLFALCFLTSSRPTLLLSCLLLNLVSTLRVDRFELSVSLPACCTVRATVTWGGARKGRQEGLYKTPVQMPVQYSSLAPAGPRSMAGVAAALELLVWTVLTASTIGPGTCHDVQRGWVQITGAQLLWAVCIAAAVAWIMQRVLVWH